MIPQAAMRISQADQDIFASIRRAVIQLPDDLQDEDGQVINLTCHNLAMAVGYAFRLRWQHGYYASPAYPHSWVILNKHVVDVYPVAMLGGPVLLDGESFIVQHLYMPQPTIAVSQKHFHNPVFRRHVATIHHSLKQHPRLPL